MAFSGESVDVERINAYAQLLTCTRWKLARQYSALKRSGVRVWMQALGDNFPKSTANIPQRWIVSCPASHYTKREPKVKGNFQKEGKSQWQGKNTNSCLRLHETETRVFLFAQKEHRGGNAPKRWCGFHFAAMGDMQTSGRKTNWIPHPPRRSP